MIGEAALAAAFFTGVGLPWARLVLPASLALGAAPALGWALFCAIALPAFALLPFGAPAVLLLAAASLVASLLAHRLQPNAAPLAGHLPGWAAPLAALTAIVPAIAILPVNRAAGVFLAPPIFDHAKVAIVDQILRSGMPPGNPFYGQAGHAASLAYYYLWHFSAAMLAEATGSGGWAADASMTWFTAFASLLLVMALASAAGGGRRSVWIAAALCLPAGLRPWLIWLAGDRRTHAILPPMTDFGAWTNQASWVPQHLASGTCVVLAALLLAQLPRRNGWRAACLLPLVVAAGFESSVWVGGVTFAIAAIVTGPAMLAALPAGERLRFLVRGTCAALASALLIAPFARTLLAVASTTSSGPPVALHPYAGLGYALHAPWRPLVDLIAFWPLMLPFNLPALALPGLLGGALIVRTTPGARRLTAVTLAGFALACLCVTWLLRSTIENNDLGWRAPIPAILILAAAAASWLARCPPPRRSLLALAAIGLAAAGLPQAAMKFGEAVRGQRPGDPAEMARAGALWARVRARSSAGERVANNPLSLGQVTPWPDNIGWALLADRPSCFSGWATSVAYAGLPRDELVRISTQFLRVFAGAAEPGDVHELAALHDCSLAVVTPLDGAWARDPFAASPDYRLVESRPDAWRIYRRVDTAQR